VHEGAVYEYVDKGAIVALPYSVEGFATPKHLIKQDGSQARTGEKLPFKVIEFNKDSKRIIVSHSRTYEEETASDHGAAGDKKKRSSRKKAETEQPALPLPQAEKTTLGDIEELAALKEKLSE
jgi:small subunit ribosomal protein S1